ncbi:nucleotidyl transferase AbiEii/AbiGii toxin family protein [Marinobacter sp.]|jgi:predicted nucleotidyltransferase component of viral defense system|uniref:nucleotidyl transferase AbiEii/AbiGii toxin family protein n=1 Tax=Marinobacter sp. TaxID=50741 RepID=UPI0019C6B4E1|nr:nucleotidyl transferase AbiEii/AbiGii toxin family protein [Marinobacter sp.]MBC7192829.1 nucleotidyl transferase AbiEii/AbiGii toxin family protein [Marinobacter sp.]
MTLFDTLVNEAIRNQGELTVLRSVVEKEILHHDILRELSAADLLQKLTFIGGTCLRACYGSSRLSEDLDFTGGAHFNRAELSRLKKTLETRLREKYEVPITVTEPKAEKQGNVDTWKLSVNTQPDRPDMPAQRIHLDICAVPSYQVVPRTIQNHYGINLGTESLIINAQSREEIFTDKLLAFAMRPGRLKYRDLWDIAWLTQIGIEPAYELLEAKLVDHGESAKRFLERTHHRLGILEESGQQQKDFIFEISRFIPPDRLNRTVRQEGFWPYLLNTVTEAVHTAQQQLQSGSSGRNDTPFPM